MNELRARLKQISVLTWLGLAVLASALTLRFVALDQFPPGVQHDEVFVANFAQTILRGEYPIFFELNRGNEPLFMYFVAALFKLFGENVWALRGAAAVCGFGALVLTHLFARDAFSFESDQFNAPTDAGRARGAFIAFFAAAGIAFSFWSLYESRIGLHTISVYLLAAATFYAFWRGWTRQKSWLLLLSGFLAGLAAYTYRSGIFVPLALALFILHTLVFHRARWQKIWWTIPTLFIFAGLIYAPLFFFITTHPETALARLGDLSGDMDALRQGNALPMLTNVARVFGMFGVSGDPEWRYNVALRPIFDPFWALLFYAGIAIALWRIKRAAYAFVLIWLVVMLLPSILSGSDLSQHRAVGAIGAAFILPALTLQEIRAWSAARWGGSAKLFGAAATALLILLAAFGGMQAYFVTWTNNPEVRLIQRADLATAARWLDEHQGAARALVSAEFANDLDRGAFNLIARQPTRAQFFQGADTFVLPARADAFVVNPRSGPVTETFAKKFLSSAPVFESRLADGASEVQIYKLTAADFDSLRVARGGETLARAADEQIKIQAVDLPQGARAGETLDAQVWWQIAAPQVTDADALQWVGELSDDSGYSWSEAASLGYTPSQWQRGDMVVTRLPLPIPADALPQTYTFKLLLSSAHGALPLTKNDAPPASSVALGTVDIARGEVPKTKPELPIVYPSKAKFGEAHLLGSDAADSVARGAKWQVTLFWFANAKLATNYRLRLDATTETGQEIARVEETLLKGIYPTRQWRAGDYVRSIHFLEIPPDAPTGKALVRVSLWTPDGQAVGRAEGAPIAGIEIVGRAHTFEKPNPSNARVARFGDAIELVGYDLPQTALRAGQSFALTCYWRALKPADKSYTMFAHVLDANGKVIGQKDAPPLNGEAPTDGWVANEFIADTLVFDLAADAPVGAAAVEIGFYDPLSGQRLSVFDADGVGQGDRVLIEGLTIAP
jgi:4-amino-4-deoxy-L-arabinose transferase-like glycosyltransferase